MRGDFGTGGENLAFVPNATYGMNVFIRSLNLKPGDEVLGTNHEYGAVNNTWRFNCEKWGAKYINHPIPVPLTTPEAFVEELWRGVTERTKVISISHISSPTALVFPIELVCQRARKEGILTVIDGAHAPGQVDINLDAMGADYYTGNLHKWVGNAKGSAFMFARPERQDALDPLVVSHGWNREHSESSKFLDYFSWTGTHDPAAYLTAPTAIEFQQQHHWPAVRAACHNLLLEAQGRILELSDQQPLSPDSFWVQMCSIPAPGKAERYKDMWDKYRIIVPIFEWNGITVVRVSIQAYSTPKDVERLVSVIEELNTSS